MNKRHTNFDDLLDEVLERHRQGEKPDLEALCEEYPELADDIRELLPSVLLMEDVKPDLTTGGSHDAASTTAPRHGCTIQISCPYLKSVERAIRFSTPCS